MSVDGTGITTPMTFASPAAGTDFSTSVPVGQAWRMYSGSCRVVASSAVSNRTPTVYFKNSSYYLWVSSNGLDYNHDATQDIVFLHQQAFQEGPPYNAVAGQTWDITNNPGGPVINPIGIENIWLPAGTVIRYFMFNMQPGDQLSNVGMDVEVVNV